MGMLKEKIEEEVKNAMKTKKELRLSVFRMLSSAVHNKEIEKRSRFGAGGGGLSDEEIIQVVRTEFKKRKDAAMAFTAGGRFRLAAKEREEGDMLAELLPQELSDEELEKITDAGVAAIGASSAKDMGRLIGWVMAEAKGQVSGERVSALVKKKFAG